MAQDYSALLTQLKNGEIDTFTVTADDFQAFQVAYMAFESRKRVIGIASVGGTVVYHYDKETGER